MFSLLPEPLIGFSTVPIPFGQSWSIASIAGDLLNRAEARFGPRDKDWTFLGVEFTSVDNPQTWYPSSGKFVIIQLSATAKGNFRQIVFQLAHEIVHLLSPKPGMASYLEEGIATLFSDHVAIEEGLDLHTPIGPYTEAASLVGRLLTQHPSFILDLRAVEPAFHRVTATTLQALCPSATVSEADYLTRQFGT